MDAGASASARPAGLPVHDAPVGCAHPASRARPAGAASHSRKGVGRGLDRPLAASAAGPRPAITARRPVNLLKDRGRGLRGTEKRKMNTSVNELLSNPAFRPLVLLDVLAVFLMIIICLVFRRMRKGYYVEQANDARKATMLNIAVRNVTGMGVYSAPGYWDNGDLNLCRFERANGDIVPVAVEADGEGGLRVYEITGGSHRSDFSYRLLGEAEYKEIWKKPSRRRF